MPNSHDSSPGSPGPCRESIKVSPDYRGDKWWMTAKITCMKPILRAKDATVYLRGEKTIDEEIPEYTLEALDKAFKALESKIEDEKRKLAEKLDKLAGKLGELELFKRKSMEVEADSSLVSLLNRILDKMGIDREFRIIYEQYIEEIPDLEDEDLDLLDLDEYEA